MRYNYILARMAKMKRRWKIPSINKDVEHPELSNHSVKSVNQYNNSEKPFGKKTLKLNICRAYDPVEMYTKFQQKMCTRIFIAALFFMVPNWKLPKCPLTVE